MKDNRLSYEGSLQPIDSTNLAKFQIGNEHLLPPKPSESQLAVIAQEYPLSYTYLSNREGITHEQAAFIISVGKYYGWEKDDGLSVVLKGWQASFCPIQFFTIGGEGL